MGADVLMHILCCQCVTLKSRNKASDLTICRSFWGLVRVENKCGSFLIDSKVDFFLFGFHKTTTNIFESLKWIQNYSLPSLPEKTAETASSSIQCYHQPLHQPAVVFVVIIPFFNL